MGGFVVQPRNSEPFPLRWKHLVYLLRKGFLVILDIPSEAISDKSKANRIAKMLVYLQTGWFVVQCLARVKQHLPLTVLELATIGYVWCTWAIYAQWLKKPLDVKIPAMLSVQISTAEILSRLGLDPSQPYQQTPLDFISRDPPSLASQVQEHLHLHVGSGQKPLAHVENDVFLGFSTVEVGICTFMIVSIHLFGWNLVFPTRVEESTWCVATIVLTCSTSLYVGFGLIFEIMKAVRRLRVNKKKIGLRRVWYTLVRYIEKAGGQEGLPIKDKAFEADTLKRSLIVADPLIALFLISRLYLIAEALASLRALPDDTFLNIR